MFSEMLLICAIIDLSFGSVTSLRRFYFLLYVFLRVRPRANREPDGIMTF